MEIRQLKYFLAVAQEANFTRAAELVHISQPGISAQIRQLEGELGATLIDRSGRSATLTAVGEVVRDHAKSLLAGLESLHHAVDEINGLVRGRLVVGMVTACTVTPLFDALSAFHRAHPGVELSLVEDRSDTLVDRVRDGTVDLALIGAAGGPPENLDARVIVSEPIVAVVPPDHPLAARREVSLAELCAYPIVCMPKGTGIRAVLDQVCHARGLAPSIALQASAPGAVLTLAERGLGVAVLSESMTAGSGTLRAVSVPDADVPGVLALVSGTVKSPALRELLEYCDRSFGEAGPQGGAARSGAVTG